MSTSSHRIAQFPPGISYPSLAVHHAAACRTALSSFCEYADTGKAMIALERIPLGFGGGTSVRWLRPNCTGREHAGQSLLGPCGALSMKLYWLFDPHLPTSGISNTATLLGSARSYQASYANLSTDFCNLQLKTRGTYCGPQIRNPYMANLYYSKCHSLLQVHDCRTA